MPLNFEDDHFYYEIRELPSRWGILQEEIIGVAAEGDLELSIYVENLSLLCGKISQLANGSCQKTGIVSEHNGVLPLLRSDAVKLACRGSAEVRRFRPSPWDDFRELDSDQPSRIVEIKDIVVGFHAAHDFERANKIKVPDLLIKPVLSSVQTSYNLIVDRAYKMVSLGPLHWNFGSIQASIIRILHEASMTEQPWVAEQKLLESANANTARLKDLFKSQENWRQLILSDKKGRYCLNCNPKLWLLEEAV